MSDDVQYAITRHGERRHIVVGRGRALCHAEIVWKANGSTYADLPVCKSCIAQQGTDQWLQEILAAAAQRRDSAGGE